MDGKKFELCVWNPEDVQIIPQFLKVFEAAHQHPLTSRKDIFLWKHKDNPVGPSIITYAVDTERDKVIAVEALSPRKLSYNGLVYLGYESNDTSTHPDYGRRGLFTSLVRLGTEIASKRNTSFFYGFPNFNSKRGFLKLNWKDVGTIAVLVKPSHPLRVGFAFLTDRKGLRSFIGDIKNEPAENIVNQSLPEDLEEFLKVRGSWGNRWVGYRDRSILKWRFLEHPFHTYRIIRTEQGLAFVLLGHRGILQECRIVEAYFRAEKSELKQAIKRVLLQIQEYFNPDIISTILTIGHPYYDSFIRSGFYKAPSNIMFFNYPLSSCPINISGQPWAITGTDIDTQ